MIELMAILFTFRATSLIVKEEGPGSIFAKLRNKAGVYYDVYSRCMGERLAGALCCIWCTSVWVSAPVAIAIGLYRGDSWLIVVVDWLAFSAGAIIVDKVVRNV